MTSNRAYGISDVDDHSKLILNTHLRVTTFVHLQTVIVDENQAYRITSHIAGDDHSKLLALIYPAIAGL